MISSLVKIKKQLDELPRGGSLSVSYIELIKLIAPNETPPKHRLANMIKHFASSSHCKVEFTKHDDTELVEFVKSPAQRKIASDDPEQSKRFLDTAKEVGADTDDKALERAFKKITPKAKPVVRSTS